ncbi:energy-coupling factor ABC transporter permease [Methanobrevibacter olleyae]|uniref:Cobalamin biosynthesis protein CbiM n=1 Tax=Methanobrevibacter olleyae TaxID=294671 RepID=A0A126R3J6_METOL|nr:energy-coupling factor ABC transporter permease [Methanobrevibacter olleyae]AMK16225.1 cobalamin biosynthesis protein CbiM [Methanobrevibacter olleyae]SFL60701.1 cobalt/nickel transport system permease protein [Methanobrevibacter olleyae]
MHIPDGLIPMDQAIIYWIITLIVLAIFFMRISKKVNMEERLVLTAVLTAATAVTTAVSIPSPFGIPMHFFLIPLVVIILGPLSGTLVCFLALLSQAIFLGMGGITTLGANVLVIGVFLSLASSVVYDLFKNINGRVAIFIATLFGILTATVVQIVILLLTQTTSLELLLASLLPFYLVVAFIEAFINVIILELIFNIRPDIADIEKI